MPNARERVVEAAITCFAERGYGATTIALIEEAAGLSPGAGGTYRHFASKRAILDAAIEHVLSVDDDELAPVPTSLAGAARDGLAALDQRRDLMRLMFRDLDRFPDLMDRVVARLIAGPVRLVAERTASVAPHVDAEAVAVVMVGALINFKVIETMVGPDRAGVSETRLVDAWAHIFAALLAPPGR